VAFAALVAVIVVGGMTGRLVYQVLERPHTVVVTTVGCSLVGTDSANAGDVFQMWAYPYGKVLASATKVEQVSGDIAGGDPPRPVVYFEVNKHTPDFQIVDTTASLYTGSYSYVDVVAAAPHALSIDLCDGQGVLRLTPRQGYP
jgi:hypothetical protein